MPPPVHLLDYLIRSLRLQDWHTPLTSQRIHLGHAKTLVEESWVSVVNLLKICGCEKYVWGYSHCSEDWRM